MTATEEGQAAAAPDQASLTIVPAPGHRSDFAIEADTIPGGVRCERCGRRHLPERIPVLEVHGVEPGDDHPSGALVIAVICLRCRRSGVLVVPGGSALSDEEAAVIDVLEAVSTAADVVTTPARSDGGPRR